MSLLERVVALTTENTSLKQQVAELKKELNPERVLTEAEAAVLAEAKPETEAEAIAALDAANDSPAEVVKKENDGQ